MMDLADAKAIELAERMGWSWNQHGRGSINNGCIDMIDPSDNSGCAEAHSLPEFAAFAEAEMAKRGWLIEYATCSRDVRDMSLCAMTVGKQTDGFDFNPTDPYSKAEATISACLEALKASE